MSTKTLSWLEWRENPPELVPQQVPQPQMPPWILHPNALLRQCPACWRFVGDDHTCTARRGAQVILVRDDDPVSEPEDS